MAKSHDEQLGPNQGVFDALKEAADAMKVTADNGQALEAQISTAVDSAEQIMQQALAGKIKIRFGFQWRPFAITATVQQA